VSSIPDFFNFVSSSQESSAAEIILPEADSVVEYDPLASASSGIPSSKMNQIGVLAWVCILLGIVVVLIVIFSNRRPPSGPGRSRYRRRKRGKKKHLLNDRYYRGLNRY
jgi:hypothetical protein